MTVIDETFGLVQRGSGPFGPQDVRFRIRVVPRGDDGATTADAGGGGGSDGGVIAIDPGAGGDAGALDRPLDDARASGELRAGCAVMGAAPAGRTTAGRGAGEALAIAGAALGVAIAARASPRRRRRQRRRAGRR